MNASVLRHLPVLTSLTLIVGAASAQIGTLVLPAGIGDDPRSVHVIGNGHVVVCDQVDGWEHFVNVSVPSAPTLTTSFNPPYGDQWFEAEYTPMYGGRLFTAHRGGGINLIDVSVPASPVVLSSTPTIYHFRGLRYQRDGVQGVLHYNATNQGLGTYTVTGATALLSAAPVWNNYANNGTNDGNGLELIGNQLYQFGVAPNNPTVRVLKGFNVTTPQSPIQNFTGFWSNQTSSHTQLRKSLINAPRIVASMWNDGLEVLDVTVPTAPTSYPILAPIPSLTLLCWGSKPFPNSTLTIAYGQVWVTSNPSVKWSWWMLLVVPAVGAPFNAGIVLSPIETHDIDVDANSGRIYVVGRNAAGQGVLEIF
ncbi:MAG: hypothetical protein U1F36_11295 [Planctomycetota bacterium]